MTKLFKNSKSVLSCVLAFAVLAVSLFTGVVINSEAAAADEGTIDLLEFGDYLKEAGSASAYYDTVVADNGETGDSWENAIIIDSAEELVYLCKASGNETKGKYYKVADDIAGFNLSTSALDLDGTLADQMSIVSGSGKNHAGNTPGFQGHFDGNGATVYGATVNSAPGYIGLFSCVQGEVTIKNINVNKAYFVGATAAGGIVGYYKGEGNYTSNTTLTIENCSVTDSYLEVQETTYGRGVGAIVGRVDCPASYVDANDEDGDGSTTDTVYVNNKVIVKNCYVNLDEANFVSKAEDGTDSDGERVCHGGVVGVAGSNALSVSDCVVIGITPYATSESTSTNDVQHSGLANHFANVYTTSDVAITDVALGGTLPAQNFTNKVFPLTDAQLKGAAAVDNMDLDWTVWMADSTGYPELANAHKDITLVDNEDGTHAATCACGFGGIAVEHTFVDGVCACGAELNCATRKTITWDGSVATGIATGTGTKDDPYVIKSASELAWLVQQKGEVTTDKYYEIDEAIGAIVLQSADKAEAIKALDSAAAVKAYFEAGSFTAWKTTGWEGSCFAGYFDGNGATIYGMYATSANNAALFCTADGGAAIVNLAVKNSYLTSSASNYQVAAIIATTSSSSYGAKRQGIVWIKDVVVANNYMYNASTETSRSGIVCGAQETVVVENALVYGNDATYGAGVKFPMIGNSSGVPAPENATYHDGLEPVIYVNEEKGERLYYNIYKNIVALGCDIKNTAANISYRVNEPMCFSNVYTDGALGEVQYANGSFTYTEEQIKAITVADLATAELGDAWINTDSYPELRSFHDEVFTGAPNADDNYSGHSAACSCGVGGVTEKHTYEVDDASLGFDATYKCTVCDFVCDHMSMDHVTMEEWKADCVNDGGYTGTCDCGFTMTETYGDCTGHNFTSHNAAAGADCQTAGNIAYKSCSVCGKNYAADAVDKEPFENALTDITGDKGSCIPNEDESGLVYGADANNHWTTCSVCNEVIETTAHTGTITPNGAAGHMVVCDVCKYESDNAEHVFGDDNVCDTCNWACEDHDYVDGDATNLYSDKCQSIETYCSICGAAGEARLTDHDVEGQEWRDLSSTATCTEAGKLTQYKKCNVCEGYGAQQEIDDAATGHSFYEYEAKDATCSFEGHIAHKSCSNCWNNFAVDAADNEPMENALADEEVYIAVDPEAHVWVEYEAKEATCEEDGYAEDHKYCSECYLFVIGEEVTDIVVEYDVFYAVAVDEEGNVIYDEEWNTTPVGHGALAGTEIQALEEQAWAEFIAENYPDLEIPVRPGMDAEWEDWEAYYAAEQAFYEALGDYYEAWEEFQKPYIEEANAIWENAYHQYFIDAAAADEENPVELVIPATGHNIVKVDEVPATYEAEGTKAHYACEDCGNLYADAEGTEEVTAEELVIAKLVKEEEKDDDKTSTDDKTEGDNSDKSPATGESVASVAAVAALMGAAFVLVRKARKA